MASSRLIRTLALCGSLGLLALPHSAKAEYGYKDRIFEQKYVLPEKPSDNELVMLRLSLMMIGITPEQIDGFFSAELAQAMGGLCDWAALQKKAVSRPPASPAQEIIAQAPEPLSKLDAKPRPPEVTGTELCLAQTVLFKKAYGDGLSTDRQLSDLAAATRRRFAANWIPQAELQRTDVQTAAQRLWTILWRVQRLAGVGVVVPAADGGALEDIPIKEALKRLMGDEPYATIDRRLTEIEEETARALQAREAARKQKDAQRQEEARLQEETQRQDEARRQEDSRAMRDAEAREGQAKAQATAAADALDAAQGRVARARQSVQAAERRLQERSAAIQADQARRMQSLAMGMARGPSGMAQAFQGLAGGGGPDPLEGLRRERAQAQRELDQAMAALAALRSAQKTASASQAAPVGQPSEERCVEGGRCTIVERTVFCRTPQQLATLLSERPGPARRRVRDILTDAGECAVLDVGEALSWTGPRLAIQPKGEAAAALLPVQLVDGRTGFVLSGGVGMSAPATAQR
ncbi:hypothetical protein V5G24_21975 [Xanthobacter sp. VTT E-85241]|uniref:hypothetical protein n=1 Tax=Roseixanthobacter finlandensis TaxID=3119922 RepID=UPI0037269A50